MGIAWIGNVLFFNANLIFVAYIMTIFIACPRNRHIHIVCTSLKAGDVDCIWTEMDTDAYFQVMDAYKKWWRKQRKLSSAATLSETPLQTKTCQYIGLL